MKKLISLILAVATLTLACSTTGKTLATVATTVDRAMEGWAAYVVLNNVSEDKQTSVRTLYIKYQASMAVATKAYSASAGNKSDPILQQAIAALNVVQLDLLSLIKKFQIQ